MEAYKIVCQIVRIGNIPPARNLQKAAMNLLSFTTIQQRDFSQPISVRASRVLGPISRHHVAQIIHMVRNAARSSRQGLAVAPSVLCNCMGTTRRFHVENEEHSCRLGCPNELDCLSHHNRCPLLSNIFGSLWRKAEFHPRENHVLYDLITQVLHRSLQHGIAVMGFIDAFVYVHNYHWHNLDIPGRFKDCMEERIRLVTAVTPAYAHAYQAICLARRPIDIPCQRFRLPSAKAKYPNLPNIRTITRNNGDDHKGWAVFTVGGTHIIDSETTADPMEDFTSCLVRSLPLAHFAYEGRDYTPTTRRNSPALLKHCPSSSLQVRSPVSHGPAYFYDSTHAANICVVTIQPRTNVPCHNCEARSAST